MFSYRTVNIVNVSRYCVSLLMRVHAGSDDRVLMRVHAGNDDRVLMRVHAGIVMIG